MMPNLELRKSKILHTWDEGMRGGGLDGYSNYGGDLDHANMYVCIGRNRDSCLLDNHNYEEFIKIIEEKWEELDKSGKYQWIFDGLDKDEDFHPYRELSFGHWACGWIELLLVHPGIEELVEVAEETYTYLHEEYPILSEDEYYRKEWNKKEEIWVDMSIKERMWYLEKAGLSTLKARHSSLNKLGEDGWRVEEYIEV